MKTMPLICYQEAEAVVCKMFVRLTGAAGRMEPDVPETVCWSQMFRRLFVGASCIVPETVNMFQSCHDSFLMTPSYPCSSQEVSPLLSGRQYDNKCVKSPMRRIMKR